VTALRTTSLWLCALTTVGMFAACTQDAGSTCQTNSNCDDGYICCMGMAAERGYCGKAADPECTGIDKEPDSGTPVVDAGMSVDDSGAADASVDANVPDAMMSTEDAGGDAG
jgi:hypothetical protein